MLEQTPRQVYRVEAGPCWDALNAWRKQRQKISDQYFDFAKSVGGTGFYPGHDDHVGNATAIAAVTFEGALPSGWKRRNWRSSVVKDGQTPAWPDQRTKVGREALSAIKKLPLRPSSYHVCRAIGFPTSVSYSKHGECTGSSTLGLFECALIGWTGETFYISLPKVNDEIERYEAQGYSVETPRWEPLAGMVPILKEEMDLEIARAEIADKAVEQGAAEDLGLCDICLKRLQIGQFVNVYDDIGSAHADCEYPFRKPSEPTPAPADDGSTMRTFVLLGSPATLFEVNLKADALAA